MRPGGGSARRPNSARSPSTAASNRSTPALWCASAGWCPRVAPLRVAGWPWPFRIATLGRFELLRAGAPVEFSGKGPGRPMELLKVLVALGGQNVRAEHLGDALWPHVDADYAHKSFTATLHRLRRLLGDDDALLLRDGRLSLGAGLVWVDAWALESVMAEFDEALRGPPGENRIGALQGLVDEAFALYRGPFLPDESEQPGYLAYREQIRARLLRCLARVARASEDAGRPEAGIDAYQRLIDADPALRGAVPQFHAELPARRRPGRGAGRLRAAAQRAGGEAQGDAVRGNPGGLRGPGREARRSSGRRSGRLASAALLLGQRLVECRPDLVERGAHGGRRRIVAARHARPRRDFAHARGERDL